MGEVIASAIELSCWWCYESLESVGHAPFAVAGAAVLLATGLLTAKHCRHLIGLSDPRITLQRLLAIQLPAFAALQLGHLAGGTAPSGRSVAIHLFTQILVAGIVARSAVALKTVVTRLRMEARVIVRSPMITGLAPDLERPSIRQALLLDRPLRAPPLSAPDS